MFNNPFTRTQYPFNQEYYHHVPQPVFWEQSYPGHTTLFSTIKSGLTIAQRIAAFRFKDAIDNAPEMEICIISGINGPDLTRIGARFPNNGTDSHEIIYYEKT